MGGTKGIVVSIKLAKSNNNFIGKIESTLANFTFESKSKLINFNINYWLGIIRIKFFYI